MTGTMLRNAILCGAAALLVGSTAIGAAAPRISGVVAAKGETSLQIATKAEGTKSVGLDKQTDYMKWITEKPFGADTRATASMVTAGSCVEVELRDAGGSVAKTVRVNTEPAGSMFDPCKTIR
jgi:hypothetical protein